MGDFVVMTPHCADDSPVSYAAGTFSDVDASGQSSEHAAYLDRLADHFADLRRSWLSRLDPRPGDEALDAGSGMGEVTRALATMVAPGGRAIGVDLSAELVERANQRAASTPDVAYRVGDLTGLPFDEATFDLAYCERVFQHLADPDGGMAELFRVLRHGGRLAAVDPDFTRSAHDADDADVSDMLAAATRRAVANPSSGRRLRSQMVRTGFIDVAVHPTVLVTTDADRFRTLSPRSIEERVEDLVAGGELARERADAFLADQDRRIATGRFLVATPLYCVIGTKPAAAAS